MNLVVGDLKGCAVYLDYVVIYSDNWETHLVRIHSLFQRLLAARLSIWPNVSLAKQQLPIC